MSAGIGQPPANPAPPASAYAEVCAALRGEVAPLSAEAVELARLHRIHLILAQAIAVHGQHESVRAALADESRQAAIADLFRERELRRLLGRLADAGIEVLLLKGAGLAYTVYEAPHLRPRADLDVVIARANLEVADRTLLAGGWIRVADQSREAVTTQRHYVLGGVPFCAEHLDLHWKIAVPHIFREVLTFDELSSRSLSIGALGPSARTLSLPDALLLACLHRVAHHRHDTDLVWLWDIHLLASRLTDSDRVFFVELAGRRAMRAVCAQGLELVLERFATPGADALLEALRPSAGDPREPSADFLGGGMRQVDLLRRDLSSAGGLLARLRLLGGHLVPHSGYMRSIYPGWPAVALPLAYIHRIVRGVPEWFRRPAE